MKLKHAFTWFKWYRLTILGNLWFGLWWPHALAFHVDRTCSSGYRSATTTTIPSATTTMAALAALAALTALTATIA